MISNAIMTHVKFHATNLINLLILMIKEKNEFN